MVWFPKERLVICLKIKDLSSISRDTSRVSRSDEKHAGGDFTRNFQRQLNDTNAAEYEKHLRDLADKITEQGSVLGERVDLAEFQKYRALITELLQEAAGNAYAFFKADKFDTRGRHKVYAIIRRVNQRLDEMVKSILQDEADNLETLGIVDEIQGMLVDLLM